MIKEPTGKKNACSFCGNRMSSKNLMQGASSYICYSCVDRCYNQLPKTENNITFKYNTPRELISELDKYVIGQDYAKKVLAVAAHDHYKRINMTSTDVEIEKSNVLLLGPTGSGKTLLAKTLSKILGVPMAIGDATTITEAGYVGEDVENLLVKLLHACEFDIEKAQQGIIFVDEIDKIARTSGNVSITRDVSGEGVQQSLLKILEGTISNVPPNGGRKHPEQEYTRIDTTNILFICGGAFTGIEKIIANRMGKSKIGFGSAIMKDKDLPHEVIPEDLIEFGLIPEFIGRLPVRARLDELDIDALIQALTGTKNALVKQYEAIFAYNNAKLEFTEDALRRIAETAKEQKTGARGLKTILEKILLDARVDIMAGKHYLVTERSVDEGGNIEVLSPIAA